MNPRPFAALALAAALAACATEPGEQAPPAGQEVSIPFADFGAIRSWREGPDDTLLLQGTHGRWYQATFFGSCPEVRFAESIGVISDATGSVNRFTGIIVQGRRCYFRSVIEAPDPDAPAPAPVDAPQ